MSYRHIPNCTVVGERVSGHHYVNESRPEQQFTVDIHWETMTVHVRVLDSGQWRTVSVSPVNADSPAR